MSQSMRSKNQLISKVLMAVTPTVCNRTAVKGLATILIACRAKALAGTEDLQSDQDLEWCQSTAELRLRILHMGHHCK